MAESAQSTNVTISDLSTENVTRLFTRVRDLHVSVDSLFSSLIAIYRPERFSPGASKTAIGKLRKKKVVKNGGECLICLKEYKVGRLTTIMPCKHSFHSTCLLKWLRKMPSHAED